MNCTIKLNNSNWVFNTKVFHHISIPLEFNGKQPINYGVPKAQSKAFKKGNVIGDTRLGGSCNFDELTLTPHCNGTHTECLGHAVNERLSVHHLLRDAFIPAVLISVDPQKRGDDYLITKDLIKKAISSVDSEFYEAVIIRTLPNTSDKVGRDYTNMIPPYFELEAISFLNQIGVNHLLVDMPSIDQIYDEGKLLNHRKFWSLSNTGHDLTSEKSIHKTITEMIFVPDQILDGCYLLNIQIAAFQSDASPSRPIIFPIKQDDK